MLQLRLVPPRRVVGLLLPYQVALQPKYLPDPPRGCLGGTRSGARRSARGDEHQPECAFRPRAMSADASTPASGAAGIGIGPMGASSSANTPRAPWWLCYEALRVQTAELANRGKGFLAPTRDCVFPESCLLNILYSLCNVWSWPTHAVSTRYTRGTRARGHSNGDELSDAC